MRSAIFGLRFILVLLYSVAISYLVWLATAEFAPFEGCMIGLCFFGDVVLIYSFLILDAAQIWLAVILLNRYVRFYFTTKMRLDSVIQGHFEHKRLVQTTILLDLQTCS